MSPATYLFIYQLPFRGELKLSDPAPVITMTVVQSSKLSLIIISVLVVVFWFTTGATSCSCRKTGYGGCVIARPAPRGKAC